LIAGEGSMRRAWEALAATLGVAGACRFLGHFGDVEEFHHALDLFVQSSEYEGTPNVVLEAMAMETPIVATAAGGTDEVITEGKHGLVVPPGDAAALARAIEQTMAQRAAAEQRVQAARRRVETELSFARRMQKVEAIYEELACRV
jgi:glycosyltransferase involved in cell wall biosynthesis